MHNFIHNVYIFKFPVKLKCIVTQLQSDHRSKNVFIVPIKKQIYLDGVQVFLHGSENFRTSPLSYRVNFLWR